MSKVRGHKPGERSTPARRRYTQEFKEEAVRMVLDGHAVASVCERLGLSGSNVLYAWKRKLVQQGGATAVGLEARVRELEADLKRVERERDILTVLLAHLRSTALGIFGRDG